jgi:heme A synthase
MGEYGSLFGWLIVTGLTLALLNFPIKLVYRKWISAMNKESGFKKVYSGVQKIIVKYHRFFAGFATLMLIVHLIIQLQYRWLSTTGLIAAILLAINGFLGGYGHYVRKKKKSAWLYVHRSIAVLAALAIILHIVMRGR